jgi:hypothetical protein
MRRTPIALVLMLMIGDAALSLAAADCTCRSQGRDYELGKSVCLSTPKGARIATCGMVLNNTSWQFSETPCVVSEAPADVSPPSAGHDHASHQHASHGG